MEKPARCPPALAGFSFELECRHLIFYYVDGPCGSAKTYAAVRYAHRLARLGKKVLFVQPSIFLINQTLTDLASLTPEVRFRAIHGETSDRVIADIIEHTKHTALDGEILFITHCGSDAAAVLPSATGLACDHGRDTAGRLVRRVQRADTHRLITDCFAVDAEAASLADNRYVRAVPKDHAALEQMARNRNCDQVWDIFQQFANVLISPHWSAYVLDDQYTNLINGVGERRKLLAFAHLKPSLLDGFASATIMGACFKQSVLYQLWSAAGVQFRPHKAITKGLRYTKHSNGHLLTILYATEEDWSKNYPRQDAHRWRGDRAGSSGAARRRDLRRCRVRMDGQQGRAGRHLQGSRPAAAELAVRTEPVTSTSIMR